MTGVRSDHVASGRVEEEVRGVTREEGGRVEGVEGWGRRGVGEERGREDGHPGGGGRREGRSRGREGEEC